jgi:hypothetical protein
MKKAVFFLPVNHRIEGLVDESFLSLLQVDGLQIANSRDFAQVPSPSNFPGEGFESS